MLWKAWLLLASVVFFGWWDWQLCLVLALLVVVAQAGAIGVHRASAGRARAWVVGSVAVLLAAFVAVARCGIDGLDGHVVVPLGLGAASSLRCISYVVDVRRGVLRPGPVVDVALALSFFPAIVAGPLVRPSSCCPSSTSPPDAGPPDPGRPRGEGLPPAARRPVRGCGWWRRTSPPSWSIRSSPTRAPTARWRCSSPSTASRCSSSPTWPAMPRWPSALALLLGLRLPENFDRAASPPRASAQFWRRWTTTFSLWFRDYVYAPLGGSRLGGALEVRNLLVTMRRSPASVRRRVVGPGVGCGDGCRAGHRADALTGGRAGAGVVGWLITFNVVALGWTVVRAGDLADLGELLARLTSFGDAPLVTPLVLVVIAGVIAVQPCPADPRWSTWPSPGCRSRSSA